MIVVSTPNEGSLFDRLLIWLREQPEFDSVAFTYAGDAERAHITIKDDQTKSS